MKAPAQLFFEEQQFRQPFLWAVVLANAGLFWALAVVQLIVHPLGREGYATLWLVFAWLLCGIALPLLFYYARLVSEVREDGIYVQFRPFHRKQQRFGFDEISQYQARTYRPLLEYGGWGIRYGRHGKAYNASGNKGVQLVFTNGKRLLIGSQRPEEFVAAIESARRQF